MASDAPDVSDSSLPAPTLIGVHTMGRLVPAIRGALQAGKTLQSGHAYHSHALTETSTRGGPRLDRPNDIPDWDSPSGWFT
jgi:hypothetical protein